MESFLQDLFINLTAFPGNLTYHLVLAFAVAGALFSAFNHLRSSEFPQSRRLVIGLALLLGLRLVYFVSSGLIWQGAAAPHEILPPLDRGVTSLGLVVIIWLWAFPEPSPRSNMASGLIAVLILILVGFSFLTWTNYLQVAESRLYFDQVTNLTVPWDLFSLSLLGIGTLTLIIRKPNRWGIGLGMLLILAVGHALQMIYPPLAIDYPGMVRLAQLAAYPILLTLPDRFPLPLQSRHLPADPPLTIERRAYSTETETFRAFMTLTMEKDPAHLCDAFTRTISHIMLADITFLVALSEEEGELIFECGYDLIREQAFQGTTFSEQDMPVLYAALKRGRTLKLPASSTSPDLQGLSKALGLERAGHLIAVPIPRNSAYPITGVVLLSPYSNRAWSFRDEEYLVEAAASLDKIARRNMEMADQIHQVSEAQERVQFSETEATKLKEQVLELQEELAGLYRDPTSSPDAAQSLAALLAAQEEAQETIHQLEVELEAYRQNLASAAEVSPQNAVIAMPEAESQSSSPAATAEFEARNDPSQAEVISTIAQDLRQPMSSIIGYTELLLSESVGILGTLQIKFLERIKASVERMRSMADDLIQVLAMENGQASLVSKPVELSKVIDDAIAFTRGQLREKSISLRVDLPDHLPEIRADPDAMLQILIHLLQNAGTATPVEGKIALRAKVEENEHHPQILLQVSDSGGGIAEEDLDRVFSRAYQAEKALIQGVGETGVGLALVKTLVEAQAGQIWVDTQTGEGSTFSVRLPIADAMQPEQGSGGHTL